MRWLTLVMLMGGLAPGCTTPMGAGSDGGRDAAPIDAGIDAATLAEDVGTDAAIADAGLDAGADGGLDAGASGALSVSGGVGTHGGAIPVSGSLVIVDDGFDLSGMTCNGSLCVYGGFR